MIIISNSGILEKLDFALVTGFLRYKLLPVICRPDWLSAFNFVPCKISHPVGSLRSYKIVPVILSANCTN
jgi:hypothetical protein